jgi:hypothetical protein
MRGLYTAAYLEALAKGFAKQRGVKSLSIKSALRLIAGTSTGAIVACAIATDLELDEVIKLYRTQGTKIFPKKIPRQILSLLLQSPIRPSINSRGARSLRAALADCFGTKTLGQVYRETGISLCIPAVNMRTRRAWVFKTPHLADSNHRDDDCTLVDVCMASTAAPIYRSLAAIDSRVGGTYEVFVDGGLWANNPVMVALLDCLQLQTSRPIQVFCAGNPNRLNGSLVARTDLDWGFGRWRFGATAADVSIDAQDYGVSNIARLLSKHFAAPVSVVDFPRDPMRCDESPLTALDDTSEDAARALVAQALADADRTNSISGTSATGIGDLVRSLFYAMQPRS